MMIYTAKMLALTKILINWEGTNMKKSKFVIEIEMIVIVTCYLINKQTLFIQWANPIYSIKNTYKNKYRKSLIY